MYSGLLSLLILVTTGSVYGQFDTGATTAECDSLQPDGSTPETGTAPFIVAVTSATYTPGGSAIQVFIASANTIVATGIVLQARRASDDADNTAFGSFNVPSGGNYQSLQCGTSATDTITNTNTNPKSLPLSFMWNPPAENVGSIEFIVSLVDTDGQFWSNVRSTGALPSIEGPLTILSIDTCPVPVVNQNNVGTWTAPDCLRDGVVQSNSATCVQPSGTTFPVGTSTVVCTCSDRAETAECIITIEIVGPPEPCDPNPCENGGTCIDVPVLPDGFICQCPNGMTLPTCPPIDPCNPNPCQNGGTCSRMTATQSGFVCTCPANFDLPLCTGNPPETPTCPGSQTAIAPPGSTSVSVQYNAVLCNDIEDGVFLANCLPPSGSQFGIETTAVVCTCADSDGLVSSCSFQVTVTGIPGGACDGNPCSGNECRTSTSSLAGYTCHSVVGTPCQ